MIPSEAGTHGWSETWASGVGRATDRLWGFLGKSFNTCSNTLRFHQVSMTYTDLIYLLKFKTRSAWDDGGPGWYPPTRPRCCAKLRVSKPPMRTAGEHQDKQSTPLASFQEALLPIAHIGHASMGIICKFQKRGTLKVK